jgi:hypothetical protein
MGLAGRATSLSARLDALEQTLARTVEQGISDAKVTLVQARQDLGDYQKELERHEAESREVGGSVLGGSFKNVKAKFYDVIVRTDVGNVDVAWSQKEDADDDGKRLNLARARELKQLRDEFKDILDEQTQQKAPPKKPVSALPPPEGPPGASPDKGGKLDTRVNPGDGTTSGPAPVRPDDTTAPKKDPKKDPKKTGGGR